MRVVLERLESSDEGTFGCLTVDYGDNYRECREMFYTGELPERNNKKGLSCIPKGVYKVSQVFWPHGKKMAYMLHDVPGRDGILIHSANFMGDKEKGFKTHLQGCIALGLQLGRLDGQKAILLSTPAVRRFETILENKPFELEIR